MRNLQEGYEVWKFCSLKKNADLFYKDNENVIGIFKNGYPETIKK